MFFDRPEAGRKAVILQVVFRSARFADAQTGPETSLAECEELARTAAVDLVATVTASRDHPHPRWFIGQGKLSELRERMAATAADLLIVILSPSHAQAMMAANIGAVAFRMAEVPAERYSVAQVNSRNGSAVL